MLSTEEEFIMAVKRYKRRFADKYDVWHKHININIAEDNTVTITAYDKHNGAIVAEECYGDPQL